MTAQWSKRMVPGQRGTVYRFVRDAEMIPGVRCEAEVDLHGHRYPAVAAAAMLAALQRLEAEHDTDDASIAAEEEPHVIELRDVIVLTSQNDPEQAAGAHRILTDLDPSRSWRLLQWRITDVTEEARSFLHALRVRGVDLSCTTSPEVSS